MSENENILNIKNELKHNSLHLNTFNDADDMLFCCYTNKYIIFDNIAVKNYFLNKTERNIINCNSSYEKFVENMNSYDEKSIFSNINFCNDFDILSIVKSTNNLLVD